MLREESTFKILNIICPEKIYEAANRAAEMVEGSTYEDMLIVFLLDEDLNTKPYQVIEFRTNDQGMLDYIVLLSDDGKTLRQYNFLYYESNVFIKGCETSYDFYGTNATKFDS